MTKDNKSSGVRLILTGLLGAMFFWLTDPRNGWVRLPVGANATDAVHNAATATYVGIAGSVAVLLVGIWLMTRRAA